MQKSSAEKREEALLAISLWRESGLSQGAFCRNEGISRSTFQHWRRRYDPSYEYKVKKKPPLAKPNERFIPVVPPLEVSGNMLPDLEIIYPNGVRIKCSTSISLPVLQNLISIPN